LVKVIINAIEGQNRSTAVVCLKLKDDKKFALWSVLLGNSRPESCTYLSRVGTMAVAIIHGWHDIQ
jgi:hypothetical protein